MQQFDYSEVCYADIAAFRSAFIASTFPREHLADLGGGMNFNVQRLLQLGAALTVTIFGPSAVQSKEIIGLISAISTSGEIEFEDGRTVLQWGVRVEPSTELTNLLVGKRVECIVLNEELPTVFADCRVAPDHELPDNRREFLDLLTWLPLFGHGIRFCDNSALAQPLMTFDRLVGDVGYACRNGLPLRSENRS